MLDGRKRIECRLSSLRRPVFSKTRTGDWLWFKMPSGPIAGVARVGRCQVLSIDDKADLKRIAKAHARDILAPPEFWRDADWVRCVALIWIEQVLRITPFAVPKSDRAAWVALEGPPIPGAPLRRIAALTVPGAMPRRGQAPSRRN